MKRITFGAATVVALGLSACGPSTLDVEYEVEADGTRSMSADLVGEAGTQALKAGDTVKFGLLHVAVPEQGKAITAVMDRDNGPPEVATVRNHGGVVTAHRNDGTELEAQMAAAAECSSPSACDDTKYNLFDFKWKTTYNWYFNAASTPVPELKDLYEDAIQQAVRTITTARDDCGIDGDGVSATQAYQGRTSDTPGMTFPDGNLKCETGDKKSIVGFKSLPVYVNSAGQIVGYVLGVACIQHDNDKYPFPEAGANEVDIGFTTQVGWFSGLEAPTGDCRWKYSLKAVATHEFGHAFGLAHVSECHHEHLTMSTQSPPCSNAPNTLGRGDVKGLRAKY